MSVVLVGNDTYAANLTYTDQVWSSQIINGDDTYGAYLVNLRLDIATPRSGSIFSNTYSVFIDSTDLASTYPGANNWTIDSRLGAGTNNNQEMVSAGIKVEYWNDTTVTIYAIAPRSSVDVTEITYDNSYIASEIYDGGRSSRTIIHSTVTENGTTRHVYNFVTIVLHVLKNNSSYKILRYDTEGGYFPSNSQVYPMMIYPASTAVTLSTAVIQPSYVFTGWILNGNPVQEVTLTSNVLVIATWRNSFTLTYNTNGGTFSSTPQTVFPPNTVVTLATNISRTGYVFDGWTLPNSSTYVTQVTMDADRTVNANWHLAQYTVTFVPRGDGTVSPASKTVTYSGTYGSLPMPDYHGTGFFHFWSKNSLGIGIVTPTTTVTTDHNHNLYGIYSLLTDVEKSHSVTSAGIAVTAQEEQSGSSVKRYSWVLEVYVRRNTSGRVYISVSRTMRQLITDRYSAEDAECFVMTWPEQSAQNNAEVAASGISIELSQYDINISNIAASSVTGSYRDINNNYSDDDFTNTAWYVSTRKDPSALINNFAVNVFYCIRVRTVASGNLTYDLNGGSMTEYSSDPHDGLTYYYTPGTTVTLRTDPTREGYRFTGWTLNGSPVSQITIGDEDITVVATWDQTYTITWAVRRGIGADVLETDENVLYGTMPSYDGPTPTKADSLDGKYSYEFTGWSPTPAIVTKNQVYYAQFNQVLKKYKITWKNYDNSTLKETMVSFDDMPSYGTPDPTRPQTTEEVFTFSGWSPEVHAVDGAATYTAQYTATPRPYTITWKNYDNSTLETDSTPYGSMPRYDGNKPSRTAPSADEVYVFTGWSPTVASVTGNATYTAQFLLAPASYPYKKESDGRLYVYDEDKNIWTPIDDAAFVMVFKANGGHFNSNTLIPQIKVTECKKKESNGKVVSMTVPGLYADFGPLYYTTLSDGSEAFIWAMPSDECTEAVLQIKNLPTESNGGIDAPPGFDEVEKWEVLAPYYKFEIPPGQTQTPFSITLNRTTVDNVRQCVVEPYWTPSRDGNLRAIAVATGLGSIDFGAIQAINTTYNSKLSVIPIVCYGYEGTFCMDLGVSKTVSISYMRVQPSGTATINGQTVTLPCDPRPDFPVYDSRYWSNAHWIQKLRDFTNRWQLRTNGCTLYLKRPDLERLSNGTPDYSATGSVTYHDPMRDFISEIEGENCYISSASVDYPVACPHMIKNSVTFMMGTLYPKQTPVGLIQVQMRWADPKNSTPVAEDESKRIYLQYPTGTAAVAPNIPYIWTPTYDSTNNKYTYVSRLYYVENNTQKYLDNNVYFTPYDGMVIYSELSTIDASGMRQYSTAGSGRIYLVPDDDATSMVVTTYLVGGGGGGGGASNARNRIPLSDGYTIVGSGGAGGASGEYRTDSNNISVSGDKIELKYTVGAGGAGGASNWYGTFLGIADVIKGDNGSAGGSSSVSYAGISTSVGGGAGGQGAQSSTSPGTWSTTPINNSYRGGDGGAASSGDQHGGERGSCPSGQNNYGEGGGPYYYTVLIHYGGGGGGGGAVAFTGENGSPKGGDGWDSWNSMNGTYGSGGGGGSQSHSGGTGGDGVVYIFITNGKIEGD